MRVPFVKHCGHRIGKLPHEHDTVSGGSIRAPPCDADHVRIAPLPTAAAGRRLILQSIDQQCKCTLVSDARRSRSIVDTLSLCMGTHQANRYLLRIQNPHTAAY
eukprot:SAG11_NODE_28039_length_326_cov_0.678414_1_plen_103_part_01